MIAIYRTHGRPPEVIEVSDDPLEVQRQFSCKVPFMVFSKNTDPILSGKDRIYEWTVKDLLEPDSKDPFLFVCLDSVNKDYGFDPKAREKAFKEKWGDMVFWSGFKYQEEQEEVPEEKRKKKQRPPERYRIKRDRGGRLYHFLSVVGVFFSLLSLFVIIFLIITNVRYGIW